VGGGARGGNGAGSTTYRVGVDIGGTFTDLILLGSDGSVRLNKVPSTPPEFSTGVITGLTELLAGAAISPAQLAGILHGTTVAANAILEGRGARTALVTTRGFRDVLEIGRLRRPALYDISWVKPVPLVPRRLRFELDLRISAQGQLEGEADPDQLEAVISQLRTHEVQSVAASFINSYARPDVELGVVEALRKHVPYVTASVDISPEIKEYERTSTAVVNAYVQPIVANYIDHLVSELAQLGVQSQLLIMQSSGGLMDARSAQARPAYMIESGPAAGVTATKYLSRRAGTENAIAFDMGGTTAKASLIEGGDPFEAAEYEAGGGMNTRHGLITGSGYVLRAPSIDIAEVGAGGGSVCWIDPGGAPRVGPQSSGAVPGPACYGRGGDRPTLTDAQVVLGYLNPVALAGGVQSIDGQLAEAAFQGFADSLGLPTQEAAYGVCMIGVDSMSRAVKAVSSQRGRDPRDFVLVAFGGAGPAYAVEMARVLGMRKVLVPRHPGLFCSIGLLAGDIQYNDVRTYTDSGELDVEGVGAMFEAMETAMAKRLDSNGHADRAVTLARFADVHYAGQSSELRIAMSPGPLSTASMSQLRHDFDAEHERTYGHHGDGQRMEIAALRLRATVPTGEGDRERLFAPGTASGPAPADGLETRKARPAYFGPDRGTLETPVLERGGLGSRAISGPLIIEEMDATTVVPPGAAASLDDLGNIIIEVP
jgi:N-methylhydantoinase A